MTLVEIIIIVLGTKVLAMLIGGILFLLLPTEIEEESDVYDHLNPF